jgi:hypothetical protein
MAFVTPPKPQNQTVKEMTRMFKEIKIVDPIRRIRYVWSKISAKTIEKTREGLEIAAIMLKQHTLLPKKQRKVIERYDQSDLVESQGLSNIGRLKSNQIR